MMDRIADHAHREEATFLVAANIGHGPRLHVHGQCAVTFAQGAFFLRVADDSIRGQESADVQVAHRGEILLRQLEVDFELPIMHVDDLIGHHDIALGHGVVQSAGKSGR